jgi:hypothetical protein
LWIATDPECIMAPSDVHQRIYQPLGTTSIRLLSIKPGFPTETLECAFVTVANLVESPPYDALSYVWGQEQSAETVICNGVSKTITKQLSDALKHLRRFPGWGSVIPWPENHPLHSRKNVWKGFARNRHENHEDSTGSKEILLWVDSLCINQKDDIERANQVKMMGKIYAQAMNVKIWLGKEDKEMPVFGAMRSTHLLPDVLSSFHIGAYGQIPIVLSFLAQALRNANGPKNRLAAMRPMEDSAHRNIAYGFPHPDAPEWIFVRDFFTNPWFERVWVVQEAVLGRNAAVLIGDWEIDWSAIGQAARWFQAKGYAVPAVLKYQLRDQQDLLPVSKSASVWKLCSWPDRRIPLLTLLHEFRGRLATNPVDKVYATFGMAKELKFVEEHGFHELVEPNYTSKTVLEVYRDIARFLIIEHGSLSVLSHAGISSFPNWPSWVPDWRHDKASNALSTAGGVDEYNAGSDQPLEIGLSDNDNALLVQGIEADAIVAYGDRLASYGFGYVTYQEEIDFINVAWALFKQRSSDPSAASRYEDVPGTFVQTLTAGLGSASISATKNASFHADALSWFAQHTPQLLPGASISQRLKWSITQRLDSGRFHEAFVRACVDRRFFVTRNGLMGVGPDGMKEGDVIAILFGGMVPYLLRSTDSGYKFVGECYVPGLMDGGAVRTWKLEGGNSNLFNLV